MTKREVRQGLLSYRNADGVWRHALAGENVDVDDDFLEDFDKLNGDEPAPTKQVAAAPKKRGRPRK